MALIWGQKGAPMVTCVKCVKSLGALEALENRCEVVTNMVNMVV
jgi:hypothetical protein